MPYFFILPAFVAVLLAGASALGLCALSPSLRHVLPYGRRMLIGSSVGFLVANLVSLLLGLVPVGIALALDVPRDSLGAQVIAAFALLGLFIGPLIASPLGFLGGAWYGLRQATRQLEPVRQ